MADSKTSALPDIVTVLATTEFPVNAAGTSKKATGLEIKAYVDSALDGITGVNAGETIQYSGVAWAAIADVFGIGIGVPDSVGNMTIVLDQSAAFAYTIDTLIAKLASGDTDAAVKINGTPVTGIRALDVTSSEATGTASAANSVGIGDTVTLVLSAGTTPVDFGATLKCTRA